MAQQFGAGVAVPPPPITGEMRESARANPNSWLYVIDPAFDATADVPQWAVVGAYPVAADGRIEDDRFAHNDTYRPSPRALGWPVPTTALERIVQLANAGHRPAGDLPAAVLDATLLVYVPTALAPTELAADAAALPTLTGLLDPASGRLVVPACTSADHVPPHWPGWVALRGRDIVPRLAGMPLAINPEDPVSAILPAELLSESVHRIGERRSALADPKVSLRG